MLLPYLVQMLLPYLVQQVWIKNNAYILDMINCLILSVSVTYRSPCGCEHSWQGWPISMYVGMSSWSYRTFPVSEPGWKLSCRRCWRDWEGSDWSNLDALGCETDGTTRVFTGTVVNYLYRKKELILNKNV